MILIVEKRRLTAGFLAVCLPVIGAIFWIGSSMTALQTFSGQPGGCQTVIIDPGHGGEDGGAVSDDGTAESGINLAISLRLEGLLRFAGVPTEMTRREDVMICDPGLETLRQRKSSDLHNRVSLVNGISDAVLLSIHQNSLPSSPVTHGAQAFWNGQSGAQALADILQEDLNAVVNTHRGKEAKEISRDIYLMNHTNTPAVLVECGFLSNREEAAQLRQTVYQMTLAAVIAAGYLRWAAGEAAK